MKRTIILLSLLIPLPLLAQSDSGADLIEQALLALPAELRSGATVVRFEDGEQRILRAGDNGLFCHADDPETAGISIWCYPRSHDEYARRWYEVAAEGKPREEVDAIVTAEIEAGDIEWPDVAVNYNLRGPSLDTAVSLTVVYMPYATGEKVGVTEERQFNRPWLMYPGTPFAHIMIPGQ